jgi:hypothetical protein
MVVNDPLEGSRMATIIFIALGLIALVAVVATFVQVARDGYRAIPNRPGTPARQPLC